MPLSPPVSPRLLTVALIVSLAAGLPSRVSVCAADEKPAKPTGRHKLGPLHLTPRIQLTSGVDTNVFQTLADPTRDAVVVLTPQLDGAMSVGRRLRLTGMGYAEHQLLPSTG